MPLVIKGSSSRQVTILACVADGNTIADAD